MEENTIDNMAQENTERSHKKRWVLFLVIGLIILVIIFACVYFFFLHGESDTPESEPLLFTEATALIEPPTESTAPITTGFPEYEPPAGLDGFIAFIGDHFSGGYDNYSVNLDYYYQALLNFCVPNSIEAQYYLLAEDNDSERYNAINLAINDGAKVIFAPGYLFANSAYRAATENPDVQFLLIDTAAGDLPGEIPSNMTLLTYKEEQAGYLAGYAAVMGGFTNLGFVGSFSTPVFVRYGYGFIQGADAAATATDCDVTIKYHYCDSFAASDELLAKLNGWYTSGTEIVFSCGGYHYFSAIIAAEANNGYVIGFEKDLSTESTIVLSSAVKDHFKSLDYALSACGANAWKWPQELAGRQTVLGIAEGCVGLPTENTYLEPFDQAMYDTLMANIVSGDIVISDDINMPPDVSRTTVIFQNS